MVLKGIKNECKKCGSVNTYITQTKQTVCRKCGHKSKFLKFQINSLYGKKVSKVSQKS